MGDVKMRSNLRMGFQSFLALLTAVTGLNAASNEDESKNSDGAAATKSSDFDEDFVAAMLTDPPLAAAASMSLSLSRCLSQNQIANCPPSTREVDT